MGTDTFESLQKEFSQMLDNTVGKEKFSSGGISVSFFDGEISASMGCYDIADWPRHLNLGPFKSEQEALIAIRLKISEATKICENTKNERDR